MNSTRREQAPAPVLKWPGSAWSFAPWVVEHLPPHDVYLETCFGSGSILCNKPPTVTEVANDLDDHVVNFFRVLREQPRELAEALALTPWSRREWELCKRDVDEDATPVERARRLVVALNQSHGHRPGVTGWRHDGPRRRTSVTLQWQAMPDRVAVLAARLRRVQFECRDALDILARYRSRDVLVFHDPPFLGTVRRGRRLYRKDMREHDRHAEHLVALCHHPGPVAVLHYSCELYDERLAGWHTVDRGSVVEHGERRVQRLYLNRTLMRRLAGPRWGAA